MNVRSLHLHATQKDVNNAPPNPKPKNSKSA